MRLIPISLSLLCFGENSLGTSEMMWDLVQQVKARESSIFSCQATESN